LHLYLDETRDLLVTLRYPQADANLALYGVSAFVSMQMLILD